MPDRILITACVGGWLLQTEGPDGPHSRAVFTNQQKLLDALTAVLSGATLSTDPEVNHD